MACYSKDNHELFLKLASEANIDLVLQWQVHDRDNQMLLINL